MTPGKRETNFYFTFDVLILTKKKNMHFLEFSSLGHDEYRFEFKDTIGMYNDCSHFKGRTTYWFLISTFLMLNVFFHNKFSHFSTHFRRLRTKSKTSVVRILSTGVIRVSFAAFLFHVRHLSLSIYDRRKIHVCRISSQSDFTTKYIQIESPENNTILKLSPNYVPNFIIIYPRIEYRFL